MKNRHNTLGPIGFDSIFSFAYLAYAYVGRKSVFVASVAPIAIKSPSAVLLYHGIVRNQPLVKAGTVLTTMIVGGILNLMKEFCVLGVSGLGYSHVER